MPARCRPGGGQWEPLRWNRRRGRTSLRLRRSAAWRRPTFKETGRTLNLCGQPRIARRRRLRAAFSPAARASSGEAPRASARSSAARRVSSILASRQRYTLPNIPMAIVLLNAVVLATPVRCERAGDLAAAHRDLDAAHGVHLAVDLAQAGGLEFWTCELVRSHAPIAARRACCATGLTVGSGPPKEWPAAPRLQLS